LQAGAWISTSLHTPPPARELQALPPGDARQTLLFSATLTPALIRLQEAALDDAFVFQVDHRSRPISSLVCSWHPRLARVWQTNEGASRHACLPACRLMPHHTQSAFHPLAHRSSCNAVFFPTVRIHVPLRRTRACKQLAGFERSTYLSLLVCGRCTLPTCWASWSSSRYE
jgi:hypothetical protein